MPTLPASSRRIRTGFTNKLAPVVIPEISEKKETGKRWTFASLANGSHYHLKYQCENDRGPCGHYPEL